MIIAVSSKGQDMDSKLDLRFGRCSYFIIIDNLDEMSFQVLKNNSISLLKGAGINSAQLLSSKNVNVLITGRCGPKALKALNAAQIKVFSCKECTVVEAIVKYREGNLLAIKEASKNKKFNLLNSIKSINKSVKSALDSL